jgi:AcrR family transcriptional regulator
MRVTREQIVRNSIRIFARDGFASATFQAIADSCKVTQPALFHHFKNKEALILASIEEMARGNYATVGNIMAPSDDAYLRLFKHFMGNLVWGIRSPDDAKLLLLLYYLAGFNERFSQIYAGLLARARARMLEHILAGRRERVFKFSEEPEELAIRFHDQLLGSFVNLLTTARASRAFDSKKELERSATRLNATIQDVLGYSGPLAGARAVKIPASSDETKM